MPENRFFETSAKGAERASLRSSLLFPSQPRERRIVSVTPSFGVLMVTHNFDVVAEARESQRALDVGT